MSRREEQQQSGPKNARWAIVLAAVSPIAATIVSCGLLGLTLAKNRHVLVEAGTGGWLTLGAVALPLLVAPILLGFSARGVSVPSGTVLFAAAVPWLAGGVAARFGLHVLMQAVQSADFASRAAFSAQGFSEALRGLEVGSTLAWPLFFGAGLGLAFASFAHPADKRHLWMAVPSFVAGGASVAVLLAASSVRQTVGLILPVCAATVVMAIAAASVGRDEPRRRSGALAAAAVLSVLAGLAALAASRTWTQLSDGLSAFASVDTERRAELLSAILADVAEERRAVGLASLPFIVWGLVVGVSAVVRTRPRVPAWISGLASIVVLLIPLLADATLTPQFRTAFLEVTRPPWARADGAQLEPLVVTDTQRDVDLTKTWLLLPSGLIGPNGQRFPLSSSPMSDSTRADVQSALAPPPPDDPDDAIALQLRGGPAPTLRVALAVDARVQTESLRDVLSAFYAGGVQGVDLIGKRSLLASPSAAEPDPELAEAFAGPAAMHVWLRHRARDDDGHPEPWATTVVAGQRFLDVHAVEGDRRVRIDGVGTDRTLLEQEVFVAFQPNVSVPELVQALGWIVVAGGDPLVRVLPGAHVSGDVDAQTAYPAPEVEVPSGAEDSVEARRAAIRELLGRTDRDFPFGINPDAAQRGHGGMPTDLPIASHPTARLGSEISVLGQLPREIVIRVALNRRAELTACYERALLERPRLEGRVVLSIVIGTVGRVSSVEVSESELGQAVDACVIRSVRTWVFPSPAGGIVRVRLPLVFHQ